MDLFLFLLIGINLLIDDTIFFFFAFVVAAVVSIRISTSAWSTGRALLLPALTLNFIPIFPLRDQLAVLLALLLQTLDHVAQDLNLATQASKLLDQGVPVIVNKVDQVGLAVRVSAIK